MHYTKLKIFFFLFVIIEICASYVLKCYIRSVL